jgi:hypothetical protein
MIKKILLSLIMLVATIAPVEAKPSLVLLSIGVNYKAVQEKREDVYAQEATHLETALEAATDTIYVFKKRILHSEEATRESCLSGMQWVVDTAIEGDLVIVYVGAHGGGCEKGAFEFYPTHDTVVASKEIIMILSKVKSHLFLLIDTCHSGAILIDWKEPGNRVSILATCKHDQGASVWGFVNPFVDSLKFADYNKDKTIDISEIEKYVKEKTDPKQTVISGSSNSKIKICDTEKRQILPLYKRIYLKVMSLLLLASYFARKA